jgi:ATP-binding cassette subfamily B protein
MASNNHKMKEPNFNNFFVKQNNQSWCGLACLSMLTKYYGGEILQDKLLHISGTNVSGTTLLGLYQAANAIGLLAEGLEGTTNDLKTLSDPAILHFTLDNGLLHYVVYWGMRNQKFIVSDPSEGTVEIDEEVLNAKWKSKKLLLVKKGERFKEHATLNKEKYDWIKSLLKPDTQILSIVLVFSVVFSALGISLSLFSQKLVDDILPSKEISRLVVGISILTALLLAKNIVGYVRTILSARQVKDFSNRIVSQFYSIILYLPKLFFDSLKTGEVTARLNDAARIQRTISYISGTFIIDVLTVIIVGLMLFMYWWAVGLITIAGSLWFAVVFFKNAKKILDGQQKVMVSYAQSESFFFDTIQGVDVIKSFGREKFFSKAGLNTYSIFQDTILDLTLFTNRIGLWGQHIAVVIIIAIISVGSFGVISDIVSLGELMAILSFGGIILNSVSSLMGAYFTYQEARVAYNRLYEFVGNETERGVAEDAQETITVKELILKNVSFRYVGRPLIIKNLNCKASTGHVNVIAGDIGCGKSTLLNLLLRFYCPETGKILADGCNIADIALSSWRRSIGIMPQSIKIFNTTLIENLCLSNEKEVLQQVLALCDNLKISDYFNALPLGFLTTIGEDGIHLSGGQKQLLGLCRALFRNPSILLLDEPTNNMDEKAKSAFWEIIQVEKHKRVCIIVTHEKDIIERADHVIGL